MSDEHAQRRPTDERPRGAAAAAGAGRPTVQEVVARPGGGERRLRRGPLTVLGLWLEAARWWFLWPAIVAAALSVVAMVVVPRLRWAIHRWEATDQALYSRSGLLWHEWRAAPLSRVQSVDMVRGPLQQRFGLATISVTTASAKGEVKIQALDADMAAEMVDRFTLLTEADQQDAT